MSGYAQPVLDTQGALDPDIELLEKPFSESTLLTKVRQAIDNPPAAEPGHLLSGIPGPQPPSDDGEPG
jgi:hypothetical protein